MKIRARNLAGTGTGLLWKIESEMGKAMVPSGGRGRHRNLLTTGSTWHLSRSQHRDLSAVT